MFCLQKSFFPKRLENPNNLVHASLDQTPERNTSNWRVCSHVSTFLMISISPTVAELVQTPEETHCRPESRFPGAMRPEDSRACARAEIPPARGETQAGGAKMNEEKPAQRCHIHEKQQISENIIFVSPSLALVALGHCHYAIIIIINCYLSQLKINVKIRFYYLSNCKYVRNISITIRGHPHLV